jgi:hypothetical protein
MVDAASLVTLTAVIPTSIRLHARDHTIPLVRAGGARQLSFSLVIGRIAFPEHVVMAGHTSLRPGSAHAWEALW